jgi:pimeloyl-ACP methyl ester carboxylesterase
MSRNLRQLTRSIPRRLAVTAIVVFVGATTVVSTAAFSSAGASTVNRHGAKPTIVLVHGAFADASGWSAEIQYLTSLGYPVIAPANPLQGLASDAQYIDSVLATIPGPVVLVGHSYGGAVIAAAAVKAPNVKAMVYISAFIPEQGRPASYYTDPANFPGSLLSQTTLLIRPFYNATLAGVPGTNNDGAVYINPANFQAIFAGDQSPAQAAVMAAEQRPVSGAAYNEPSHAAAKLPSWDLVGLEDRAIPPAAERYMAQQAHAHITEIHSAHDSLISHPGVVDDLILQAAHSIG